jgi:hypothetical protein
MNKTLAFVATLAFAGSALAQQYKWVENGRIRYGDVPPPGVKATPLRGPSGPAAAATPAPAGKDAAKAAPKGPLTPAQQEAEFRKRQLEAQKSQEKQAQATEEARAKQENCANAQAQLRLLESGERISRTDAKGERYFVDDEQRKADTVRARKSVSDWCGG